MGSKCSCSLAVIVFQESAKPLATANRAIIPLAVVDGRHEHHIILALMPTFLLIMGFVMFERVSESVLAKQPPRGWESTGGSTCRTPAGFNGPVR